MIRWLLALWLMAMPAWATQDDWPALHDVQGVASDDVLNVRAAPDAQSDIIGTLAHDAESIEVIRPNDRETWGLVNVGERSGWVSLAFLTRQPGQWYGRTPMIRQCYGTEPFWALDMDEAGVTFSTPEMRAEGRREDSWSSLNHRGLHAFSVRVMPDAGGTWMDGIGMLEHGACSDFMTDRAFGLRLHLLIGDMTDQTLYSGCCSLAAR